jgi:hypothetical protein
MAQKRSPGAAGRRRTGAVTSQALDKAEFTSTPTEIQRAARFLSRRFALRLGVAIVISQAIGLGELR